MWSISSWGFLLLCLVVVPVMGSGAAASSAKLFATTTRGEATKKAGGPLGVFVQTVMDARRHLVAAAGKLTKK